jgi:hypothetical protein
LTVESARHPNIVLILKIGLVSMNTAAALATFDYVHTYRLASGS